jgi:hypothetical protein
MKKLVFSTHKFKAIQRVLEANQNAFEGKAQALQARESFADIASEMSSLITDLTVPLTSVYYTRKKNRKELIAELGNMLQIGLMFASREGDLVLLNTLRDFKRRYVSVSTNEVIQFSYYFIQKINEKFEKATEVGISAETIQALQDKTDAYQDAVVAVSDVLADRQSRRSRVKVLIQEGNKILNNDLDRFVQYNATNFPDLNFAYNRVRWSRHRKSSAQTLPAESDISGTVTNINNGLPVEGATLNLIEHAHAINADKDGYYIFDDLEEGEYTITCHATGYAVPEPFVLSLSANESVVHNFSLKPAGV